MSFFYSSNNSDCIEGFIETFSAVLGDRRFVFNSVNLINFVHTCIQ